jgi:ketosteroid isomerase-like protein
LRILTPLLALLVFASTARGEPPPAAASEVLRTEEAFAAAFAHRDKAAFRSFLSPEAVFFGAQVLRGPDAIMAAWDGDLGAPAAPFSWRPEHVEALASGDLALSTGPVLDPSGKPVAVFNSIWRKEKTADGTFRWRIVFDKGAPLAK